MDLGSQEHQKDLKQINQISQSYDISYIQSQQTLQLTGYVPSNSSGVTIAVGYDLKQKDPQQMIRSGIPGYLVQKLKKYIGLSGDAAKSALQKNPLKITYQQAIKIKVCMLRQYINRLKLICKKKNINLEKFSRKHKTILLARVIHTYNVPQGALEVLEKGDYQAFADIIRKSLESKGFKSRGQRQYNYLMNSK